MEQALTSTLKFTSAFTYAKGVHASRFVDRNDPVFGVALEHRAWARTARTESAS